MSEMIKRVIDAIMEEENPDARDQYTAMAIAAINAMREPTEAMQAAGASFIYEGWAFSEEGKRAVAFEAWQSMIDAALEPTCASRNDAPSGTRK